MRTFTFCYRYVISAYVGVLNGRKHNKDKQIISQDIEKRREIKKSKEEEVKEEKVREKEAARAYERWLYRKVCTASACSSVSLKIHQFLTPH